MNGFHSDMSRLSMADPALPAQSGEGDEAEDEKDDEMEFESDIDEVYDRQAFGIYQQLPVPPGEPDLSSEPQTAEEYLQRVRYDIGTADTTRMHQDRK